MNVESTKIGWIVALGAVLLLAGASAMAQKKPGGGVSNGCATVTGAPAFAYSIRSGGALTPQFYIADASGACSRFVFGLDTRAAYPRPHSVFFGMLPADSGGFAIGRLATYDQIKGLVLAEFKVDVARPGMNLTGIRTHVLRGPAIGPTWPARTAISPDGNRIAYVEAVYVNGIIEVDIFVYDLDVYLDSPDTYVPTHLFEASLVAEEISTPRWSADGRTLYLEHFKNGNSINPSIARLVDNGGGAIDLQNLIDPAGPRLALFDVKPGSDGSDVIVFGETTSSAPYCYRLATATCDAGGVCTKLLTAANVSFYTSAESAVDTSRVLTQPVARRDCVPSATIVRTEAAAGGTATVEPLVSKGEWPSSAR